MANQCGSCGSFDETNQSCKKEYEGFPKIKNAEDEGDPTITCPVWEPHLPPTELQQKFDVKPCEIPKQKQQPINTEALPTAQTGMKK